MREVVVSNCEKAFVIKAATEGTRLDGRALNDSRTLKICFGEAWGSCHVTLGETKVAAHVSQKIEQPRQARPNEGRLFVNVDLNPMGAPNFEVRQSDTSVYISRLVEKCIADSRCVDLESLCIVAEEKVWFLRVDVHVLNHAGNIVECASVAALASLAHFKRPDVTVDGERVIVHTFAEKDPIPTVLHHYPVCVTYGFIDNEIMLADPNLLEETVCSSVGAIFVVGMNSYREICLFDLASVAITLGPDHVYKASQQAAKRTQYLVSEIKLALDEDAVARNQKEPVGFSNAITTEKLMSSMCDKLSLRLNKFDLNMSTEHLFGKPAEITPSNPETLPKDTIVITDNEVAALVPKSNSANTNIWAKMGSEDENSNEDDDDMKSDEDVKIIKVINPNENVESISINCDSEEENVVILKTSEPDQSIPTSKKKKNKMSKHK